MGSLAKRCVLCLICVVCILLNLWRLHSSSIKFARL
jgi:hypothetical protein